MAFPGGESNKQTISIVGRLRGGRIVLANNTIHVYWDSRKPENMLSRKAVNGLRRIEALRQV